MCVSVTLPETDESVGETSIVEPKRSFSNLFKIAKYHIVIFSVIFLGLIINQLWCFCKCPWYFLGRKYIILIAC